MQLNENGQCPECRIKPLTYKRDGYFHCHRCNRNYDLETKQLIANWMWNADGSPTQRNLDSVARQMRTLKGMLS